MATPTNVSDYPILVPQIAMFKSMSAGEAARLFTAGNQPAQKSNNLIDVQREDALTKQVMANLKSQGIQADEAMVRGLVAQDTK